MDFGPDFPIHDIPLDVIEEVASIYLSGRSMVLLGFGQDHYANGQTFYDGVFALADITGQECKHGAGSTCVDLTGAVAQGVQSTAGMNLDGAVAGPTVYVNHLPQLVEEGSIGEFDTAPRSMYIYYCNPLANMPDRQRWLSMLGQNGSCRGFRTWSCPKRRNTPILFCL